MGGHHLSLATHLHHQPGTEIFLSVSATNNQSRYSFLPSSFAFFTLFLLRFNAIFTLSAKSTFDLAALQLPFGHGFGLLRTVVPLPVVHGITIQAKQVSMADASKLVSIFFSLPSSEVDLLSYEVTLDTMTTTTTVQLVGAAK